MNAMTGLSVSIEVCFWTYRCSSGYDLVPEDVKKQYNAKNDRLSDLIVFCNVLVFDIKSLSLDVNARQA